MSLAFRRIGSLWDVVRFNGETFYRLSQLLTQLSAMHEGLNAVVKNSPCGYP